MEHRIPGRAGVSVSKLCLGAMMLGAGFTVGHALAADGGLTIQ